MKKIFTLIFICVASVVKAQYNFHHFYGGVNHERGQTVVETLDNRFLLNGASTSYGQGSADAIFIKNDNQGQIIWTKVYGLSDYDNSEFALETPDYGYLGVGRSTINIGSGTTDAWVYKTDSAGNLLWSKAYGNPGFNDGFIMGINTSNNGYAFIGNTQSIGVGSNDIFLVHTDANGDTIFTRTYGTVESESGIGIIQASDGGYFICGRQQTFPNGSAQSDGLIIRTDSNGDVIWSKLYGDTLWEEFQSIVQLPSGNIAIAGSTVSFGAGNYDILMMLADSNGVPINSFAYGGAKGDASYSILLNSDLTLTISGYTDSFLYGPDFMGDDSTNIFLLRTDTAGDVIWMNVYGDGLQDEAFRSSKASDGGFMISGFTVNYTPADSTQMLFIKTDSLGLSGCHETAVTPDVESSAMISNTISFIQNSGINVVSPSVVEATVTTVNNDACLFASIPEHHDELASLIYPNPYSSEVNIDLTSINETSCNLRIVDSNGRVVLLKQINTSEKINTSELAPGFYCFVLSIDKEIIVRQMVKTY